MVVDLELRIKTQILIDSVTRSSVCDGGLDGELLRNTFVGCLALAVTFTVIVEAAGAGECMIDLKLNFKRRSL